MTENEKLEKYNKKFNDKLSKRPIGNLITCPKCNNEEDKKCYIDVRCNCGVIDIIFCPHDYCDVEEIGEFIQMKCDKCNGIGYIENASKI